MRDGYERSDRGEQHAVTRHVRDPHEIVERFEIAAAPLLAKLAEVRSAQRYCRESELAKRVAPWRLGSSLAPVVDTAPALDALERDVLRRLVDLRTLFGIVVH